MLVINGDARFFEVTPFCGTDTKALPERHPSAGAGEEDRRRGARDRRSGQLDMPFAFRRSGGFRPPEVTRGAFAVTITNAPEQSGAFHFHTVSRSPTRRTFVITT